MISDEKNKFDALHCLCDQAWREWDHKSRHEWRLSSALWTVLAAATAAIIAENIKAQSLGIPVWLAGAFLLAVVGIHVYFMTWIQTELSKYRGQYNNYLAQMEVLPLKIPELKPRKELFKHPSLLTQAMITVLLSCLFLIILSRP